MVHAWFGAKNGTKHPWRCVCFRAWFCGLVPQGVNFGDPYMPTSPRRFLLDGSVWLSVCVCVCLSFFVVLRWLASSWAHSPFSWCLKRGDLLWNNHGSQHKQNTFNQRTQASRGSKTQSQSPPESESQSRRRCNFPRPPWNWHCIQKLRLGLLFMTRWKLAADPGWSGFNYVRFYWGCDQWDQWILEIIRDKILIRCGWQQANESLTSS